MEQLDNHGSPLDHLEALNNAQEQRIEHSYQVDIRSLMLEIEEVEGQRSVMEQNWVQLEVVRREDCEESVRNDMQSISVQETATASRLVQLREMLSAKQEELEACRESIFNTYKKPWLP